MKPLTANLKHLYQHHVMWICYLVFIPYILIPLGIELKPAPVTFILLYTGFWGAAIGSIVTDVWNKPFAFVLPGHIKAAKKMLVLTWLFVTLLGTTSIAGMFLSEIRNNFAVLTALMGITSLIYWAGVGLFSSHRRHLKNVFYIFYMFPIILMASSYMRNAASSSPIAHPLILTLTGGLISYLIYRDVTHRNNVRQMCGRPWKGFLDGLNRRKQKKLAQAYAQGYMQMKQDQRPGRAGKLAGNFFSERIRNSYRSTSWPHIWGQTYLIVGPITIFWKNILTSGLIILFLIFLTSFSYAWKVLSFMEFMLVIMISVIGGWIGSAYRSDFIMPVCRNAHFLRGIISMFIGVILATVCIGITILSFALMTYIRPSAEGAYSLSAVLWILPLIPIMLSPLFGGFMILLKLKPFTGGFMLGFIIVILILLTGYGIMGLEEKPVISGLIIFLLISALTWIFHACALYYDSMKRSLR
ncbi:MAG: hypothetical protein JW944_12325 [Deltaproteobacteria bacterium]|nr:hypothetical protein [Deltaproteobacteria bacterium]